MYTTVTISEVPTVAVLAHLKQCLTSRHRAEHKGLNLVHSTTSRRPSIRFWTDSRIASSRDVPFLHCLRGVGMRIFCFQHSSRSALGSSLAGPNSGSQDADRMPTIVDQRINSAVVPGPDPASLLYAQVFRERDSNLTCCCSV